MLENKTPSESSNPSVPSAASTRVTAEEFIAAIDRIEHRKAEESKRLAGTVEISETIKELGIDASPDEVMAEVEAQRRAKTNESDDSANRSSRVEFQRHILSIFQTGFRANRTKLSFFNFSALAMTTVLLGVLLGYNFPGKTANTTPAIVQNGVSTPSDTTKFKLSELTDGDSAYVNTPALREIISNKEPNESLVAYRTSGYNLWKITLHGSKYYVTGFVKRRTDNHIATDTLDFSNNPAWHGVIDGSTEEITVPITGLVLHDTIDNPGSSQAVISNVHPDLHLKDDQ